METAPVIELGRAFIELVSGELPEPPAGKIWIYGTETGREVYPPDVRFVDLPDWASCFYVARPSRPFSASFSGRRERFEMCPWCRPSVDAGFASRGVLSSTIQLHRFEPRDAQAAKVRNVSKVGSQSKSRVFNATPTQRAACPTCAQPAPSSRITRPCSNFLFFDPWGTPKSPPSIVPSVVRAALSFRPLSQAARVTNPGCAPVLPRCYTAAFDLIGCSFSRPKMRRAISETGSVTSSVRAMNRKYISSALDTSRPSSIFFKTRVATWTRVDMRGSQRKYCPRSAGRRLRYTFFFPRAACFKAAR